MTNSSNEPDNTADPDRAREQSEDANEQTGEQEGTSEPGVIGDEQLPEELQPTDDNPLAQNPEQDGDKDEADTSS